MRVTHRMISETFIANLRGNLSRLETLHRDITSGKRLSRPSDDPPAAGRALNYRASIEAGDQYVRNMDGALATLDVTDSTLGSAVDLLHRARELAVQGGNDHHTQEQRDAIAAEVNEILQQMVIFGNANLRGQRLFGGTRIDADPFTLVQGPPTTVTYTGNSGALTREIDVGATIQINVPGDAAFNSTFTALINLRNNLTSGNADAVRTMDLTALDGAMDRLLSVRAEIGAKVNRIESAKARQEDLQVRLMELLSKAQDTDFADAVSRFATQETVYKAALEAGAKAIQPSLLEFLR